MCNICHHSGTITAKAGDAQGRYVFISDHDHSPPQPISKSAGREEDQTVYLKALAKDFNMSLVGLNVAPGGRSFLEAI